MTCFCDEIYVEPEEKLRESFGFFCFFQISFTEKGCSFKTSKIVLHSSIITAEIGYSAECTVHAQQQKHFHSVSYIELNSSSLYIENVLD